MRTFWSIPATTTRCWARAPVGYTPRSERLGRQMFNQALPQCLGERGWAFDDLVCTRLTQFLLAEASGEHPDGWHACGPCRPRVPCRVAHHEASRAIDPRQRDLQQV